jgi:hypothetical protein
LSEYTEKAFQQKAEVFIALRIALSPVESMAHHEDGLLIKQHPASSDDMKDFNCSSIRPLKMAECDSTDARREELQK